jgi:hypothetical protein
MMTEKITIRSTMVQGAESASFLIEVPAVSVPPCLRSGQQIVDEIEKLFERTKKARLEKKLERFLKRAHEAEAKENHFRAGRALALALYCEGMLRHEVTDPCGYVRQAMPVY